VVSRIRDQPAKSAHPIHLAPQDSFALLDRGLRDSNNLQQIALDAAKFLLHHPDNSRHEFLSCTYLFDIPESAYHSRNDDRTTTIAA